MKPLTREWLDKADADLGTAERERGVPGNPNLDAVAFHAQQAAEKFIKAVLCELNISFPRTHDLLKLVELIEPPNQALLEIADDLERLSQSAVEARYPGTVTGTRDADHALATAQQIMRLCCAVLGR